MTLPRSVAILGTRYEDFSVEAEVFSGLDVRLREGRGADEASLLQEAGDAEVVLAGSAPRFDDQTLAGLAAQGCRGVVRYGVGTDSIDLDAARRHGLWVARVADYGTEAVATHAVTMAMAAVRRLLEADQRVRHDEWGFAPLRPLHLPSAMTVGLLGAGRIGRHAALQFAGIGFHVVAFDPYPPSEPCAATMVSFDDLLATSDVLSLHAPGPGNGAAVLDAAALAAMKPGSVLVNTARGSLVDQAALAAGLAAGRPGMAALDVFTGEPPDLSVFADVRDRLVLSPHMAWYTEESEVDMRRKAALEARRILVGETPNDLVVDPRGE
jgi:D-3-phosphoglycerate dehydrogenase / 2-oxoglutarate reductase